MMEKRYPDLFKNKKIDYEVTESHINDEFIEFALNIFKFANENLPSVLELEKKDYFEHKKFKTIYLYDHDLELAYFDLYSKILKPDGNIHSDDLYTFSGLINNCKTEDIKKEILNHLKSTNEIIVRRPLYHLDLSFILNNNLKLTLGYYISEPIFHQKEAIYDQFDRETQIIKGLYSFLEPHLDKSSAQYLNDFLLQLNIKRINLIDTFMEDDYNYPKYRNLLNTDPKNLNPQTKYDFINFALNIFKVVFDHISSTFFKDGKIEHEEFLAFYLYAHEVDIGYFDLIETYYNNQNGELDNSKVLSNFLENCTIEDVKAYISRKIEKNNLHRTVTYKQNLTFVLKNKSLITFGYFISEPTLYITEMINDQNNREKQVVKGLYTFLKSFLDKSSEDELNQYMLLLNSKKFNLIGISKDNDFRYPKFRNYKVNNLIDPKSQIEQELVNFFQSIIQFINSNLPPVRLISIGDRHEQFYANYLFDHELEIIAIDYFSRFFETNGGIHSDGFTIAYPIIKNLKYEEIKNHIFQMLQGDDTIIAEKPLYHLFLTFALKNKIKLTYGIYISEPQYSSKEEIVEQCENEKIIIKGLYSFLEPYLDQISEKYLKEALIDIDIKRLK